MFPVIVIVLVVIVAVAAIATHRHYEDPLVTFVGTVIYVVVAGAIGTLIYFGQFHNDHWATCHVTKMDRGATEGGYRIYTDDCGVLSNDDAFWRGKFDSADVWNQVEENKTYQFHLAGARIAWWSWFPNVLEVKPADG